MKMPADYITKEMLREELAKLEGKMDGKFVRYKDEILNRIDDVMGQLQAIREDNLIGTHHTRELREEVDNHELRIKKLETAAQ
ncbi:MAG: hypothetical protein UR81_C0041G0009 [Candidatus Levybacteria bacterium GW2011_GWB1_35_5]|nr:MAG: hypothetical protein UR81_C0041G0009 [Candidatus Levybacteria bacterium GW2011_GWB1_35_5]